RPGAWARSPPPRATSSPPPPSSTLRPPRPPAFSTPPGPGAASATGESLGTMRAPSWSARRLVGASVLLLALVGCERRPGCTGDYCGAFLIVATAQPDVLLPPVTDLQYARGVTDQIFLKLADIGLSQNTIGDEYFQPLLAARWEWDDPLTLVFHLDPRA